MNSYRLTLSCTDTAGIVAEVEGFIAANGGNVTESQQFDDADTGLLFLRVAFSYDAPHDALVGGFEPIAVRRDMSWRLRPADERKRVLILVSKFDHCMGDPLYLGRIGERAMEPVGIVSNHRREPLNLSADRGIPYHHLPLTKDTKPEQEARIKAIIEDMGADLVVLARCMRVLSDDFSRYLAGRCINIHHSFLPGFKGAKPYRQAYERGVKMIGATAHFVTGDLDEGPIIAQDVEPVRAVGWFLDDRVFLNRNKTVVFQD